MLQNKNNLHSSKSIVPAKNSQLNFIESNNNAHNNHEFVNLKVLDSIQINNPNS